MSAADEEARCGRRQRGLVALLALLAAARVLVYATAFPFFHQVDEHQHVDSVVRYAHGELPGPEMATLGDETALWALEFGSFEYLEPRPPPPYLRRPGASLDSTLVRRARAAFTHVENTEFDSPPVYYFAAARWLELGRAFGLADRALLYWLRGLNALALGLLVWLAYGIARRSFPGDSLVTLGVPALVAFSPQDLWFGVTSDVGAAVTGGLAFGALAAFQRRGPGGPVAAAGVGLCVAAAFLTKYTNAVYLVLLGGVLALWLRGSAGRRALAPAAALATASVLPIALWFARNLAVLGDLTGTARKVEHLQWTPKAGLALLHHPLLTPAGALEWSARLAACFWRGEFRWLGQTLAWPWMDVLYAAATAAALGVVAFGVRPRLRSGAAPPGQGFERLALLAVAGGFATLALLSLRFEFADWGTPTRADPFFVHGRLISGVWLPFAFVFVRGIERGVGPRAPRWAWGLLLGWIALVTVSEAFVNAPVFASPWNAWHAGG